MFTNDTTSGHSSMHLLLTTLQPVDLQSTCPKIGFVKHAHRHAPQDLVGTRPTVNPHTPALTADSERSHLLRAAHNYRLPVAHTHAPQTLVHHIHSVQSERAVTDVVESDSYTRLGHLQSQMTSVAAKIYHQLHWSVTPAGQMQGPGSIAARGIGFVGGWGSCTLRAGRSANDAWFPGVQVVAELGMDPVVIGAIEGFALAVTMHHLRLVLK